MKKDWASTQEAFRQFLRWLDEGVDSGGERYLEIHRRLASYFDRKNCRSPDELADETLKRVAQKLGEKGSITELSPVHYCYVTAKFVFLEYMRGRERTHSSFEESAGAADRSSFAGGTGANQQSQAQERLHECLDVRTPISRLNALEYVDGQIFANIWRENKIARISPESGIFLGWIDLSGLPGPARRAQSGAFSNGIAYDAERKRLFVTGKLWPHLFEIRLSTRLRDKCATTGTCDQLCTQGSDGS